MVSMNDPLLADFAKRVREKIEADIAREGAEAEALRQHMLPRVKAAVDGARSQGLLKRAWLFGSFAWGLPTDRSDVDLLVEGCPDPDALAAIIWRAADRAVHVVERERAPSTLIDRAEKDGIRL
jgi:predicted nucleotidyltransferase